ncbi:alpha-amylase family glycosyl hydrolase [Halomonas sp. PA16-9]|uniref:alpha-amylase family glycosyl hydrolase n=1 Tax=Halomonas sp. PA16-9 TaxID=2576841 RepID=UPI003FA59152
MGEVGDDDALGVMAEYSQGGKRLHMCYSFNLLTDKADPSYLHETLTEMEARIGDGWPCWALGNHDVTRLATRWQAEGQLDKLRLYMVFLLTQRGSVCLYQGEELGLPEAQLTFEQLVDPAGITSGRPIKVVMAAAPRIHGADARHAGFSSAAPWLPVPEAMQVLRLISRMMMLTRCSMLTVVFSLPPHPVCAGKRRCALPPGAR